MLLIVKTLQNGSIAAGITPALKTDNIIIFAMSMQITLFVLSIHAMGNDYVKYTGAVKLPKSM